MDAEIDIVLEHLQANCQETLARWRKTAPGPLKQMAWNSYSEDRDKLEEYQSGITEGDNK